MLKMPPNLIVREALHSEVTGLPISSSPSLRMTS